MLCDEGHRLKNMESQTYQALNGLKAQRRVILSGTPIQNDLTEFRKNFELPILRGRDALASDKDREASEGKLRELLDVANKFIIRRTAELLTKYLPIKYEHVVFCRLTPAQHQLYQHYSTSEVMKRLLDGSAGTQPLKAITVLKKICNHPALLEEKDLQDLAEALRPGFDPKAIQTVLSGKMLLLDRMLTMIRKTTDDKIVLISNYTQTLDLFERLCRERRWGCLRLDGSMRVSKRGKLVEKLNDNENKQDFIFLLSSKAGGCGLNLIGANRWVLFDAGARSSMEGGSTETCYIYRFIATGTLEEKIFQRQAHKQCLSSCVVDEEENVARHFSLENLRQLFQYTGDHALRHARPVQVQAVLQGPPAGAPPEGQINAGASAADTSQWNHISQMELSRVADIVLNKSSHDVVSYVFQNKSHEQVARKPTEKKSEEEKDDDYAPGKEDDDE
ncbi:hypothetical protein M427DRAFT_73647 [Gonapodya prolifera JEL478]|uniref:P-loop containing nucleoside triphosphate hydrolase protein n=1 Tax=Gonapodya prolifera (strain JEL478) TaxID=1344416 RepID=A0A139A1N7_GONPJ|nr:hypothetical protein M427DRAFT_73647 [Gonapodya prolifera JEL478]|eukprot:KXS10697.1 hypothetical protein M427DRAFT_73647 [Gonapodya prolifera JEL478]